MTDNNINVIVLQQLLHVQQQQAEDEQAVTALMRRRRRRARGARQRICWVRPWVGDVRRDQFGHYNQLMVELRREDPASFQNFLRIQPHMFDELLVWVGPRITKQDTNYMGWFFFEVPIHVDSFCFSDHLCPELIESPRISVRDPKFINATR